VFQLSLHLLQQAQLLQIKFTSLDTFELRVATSYVPKQDFETAVQKIEDHMIRIETKLDQMLLRNG
jgi:hypothetical protein